jgi:CubicO group peptidase (beta-lactamase class C family)
MPKPTLAPPPAVEDGATTAADAVAAITRFAAEHETPWPRDPQADPARWGIHHVDTPPWNRLFGPVHPRGPGSGVVWQGGRECFAWGEPDRADLTYSIAKTYLALLAGVAHDRGLLPDPDEPVVTRVPGIGFDDARGRRITWMHLLQQTSEWEGTCFGIPDTVDRYRLVEWQRMKPAGEKGAARPLQAPGSHWEYNDVRINQLSLALLHLFGRPLPEVFVEAILAPVGGGRDFRWVGYDASWVELPAPGGGTRRVHSVTGGSHWGGGVSIGARDQARIGQMLLERGRFDGRQVVSAGWVERMLAPCPIAPFYGLLTWLNHERRVFASAPASAFIGIGAGGQYMWVDPTRQAVVVARWLASSHADRLFGMIAHWLDAR